MSDVAMRNRPDERAANDVGDTDDERDATWSLNNEEHELAEYDDSVDRRDDTVYNDYGAGALFRTVEETLRQVQRELCLIKLCWPEICPVTEDLYARSLPDAYRCVSSKERLLLCYAENFRRQFHARHPDRRPLLLACENECGVQKFVSTTIRRCTPQYPELYTWQGCASFISDYIRYEAPDEAFLMPQQLRSPTWVMNFQKGNSFECATLLVGFLLGQSYNAFVASGYASHEQVLCDMSKRSCPYLPKQKEQTLLPSLPPSIDAPKVKYQLKLPPDFRSKLLLELEERKKNKTMNDLRLQEEERQKMIADCERPRPDKHFGHRIHAWVVILPENKGIRVREIVEPIFIEPSSGISYRLTEDETNLLYLGVESVWNDKNYWVNMQPRANGCAKINWDLSKTQFWEHLLPGQPWTIPKNTEMAEEDIIEQNKHLDMPASYVSEIRIHNIDFERRYPNGNKTIFYKKAKVELFAPYIRSDGLIRRVTEYEDYQYITPVRCHEKYLNRNDYFVESTRDLNTNTITDSFEKGRLDHCKAHRYVTYDNDSIDSERVIDFYDSARFDGLSRIEMNPFYLTQHYVDREDFLYYRHAEFSTDKSSSAIDNIHFRRITRIVEKYHRNEKVPAYKDIAIREFMMVENKINIKFHYNKGQSTRATRTFVEPLIAVDRLVFDSSMTYGYHPDLTALPEKDIDLFYSLNKHLKDKDQSVSRIRDAENEVASFLKKRVDENLSLQLTVSLFGSARTVDDISTAKLGTEELHPSQEDFVRELDPLGPYLARIGNPSHISRAEAYLLRDECLNDFKRLSIEKANRILFAIQERAAVLEKLQASLTQTAELSKVEEEQILAKMNEVGFDLYLLETYLNRHRESTSTRYRVLVDQLQKNPHLQSLDTKR